MRLRAQHRVQVCIVHGLWEKFNGGKGTQEQVHAHTLPVHSMLRASALPTPPFPAVGCTSWNPAIAVDSKCEAPRSDWQWNNARKTKSCGYNNYVSRRNGCGLLQPSQAIVANSGEIDPVHLVRQGLVSVLKVTEDLSTALHKSVDMCRTF